MYSRVYEFIYKLEENLYATPHIYVFIYELEENLYVEIVQEVLPFNFKGLRAAMLSEEEAFQAALEASAADLRTNDERHVLSQDSAQHLTSRVDLSSPAMWPRDFMRPGVIEQVGIVNQFSSKFSDMVNEFGKFSFPKDLSFALVLLRSRSSIDDETRTTL